MSEDTSAPRVPEPALVRLRQAHQRIAVAQSQFQEMLNLAIEVLGLDPARNLRLDLTTGVVSDIGVLGISVPIDGVIEAQSIQESGGMHDRTASHVQREPVGE